MAKGLTRKITRKQALSYRRTVPNGIGVTTIASVNGRGAAKRSGFRKNADAAAAKPATPNKRRKMRRNTGAAPVAAPAAAGSAKPNRSKAYARRYAATRRLLKDTSAAPAAAGTASQATPNKRSKTMKKRGKRKAGSAFKRSAQYKKMQAGLRKWRAKHAKKSRGKKTAPKAKKARKSAAKRPARKTTGSKKTKGGKAKYRRLSVKIGNKSLKTYLYKGKRGKVQHLPRHAVLGFSSKAALRKATKSPKRLGRIVSREQAIARARERAADRVLKHGDIFTPNARVIPYGEWSESMKANKRKSKKSGKRRMSKKARAAAIRNLRKARAAQKRKSGGRTRKAAKRRAKKSRKSGSRKRSAAKRKSRKGRKSARRAAPKRRRRKSSVKRSAPRRTRRKGSRKAARRPSKKAARKAVRTLARFTKNGRFEKNSFLASMKEMLKVGAIVGVGFMAHKAVTKLLSDEVLGKVTALDGIAKYRGILAGLVAAGIGGIVAVKLAPRHAPLVVAGMGASVITSLIGLVLTEAGQDKVANYLAAYPDAPGRAYSGYGEYLPVSGFGDAALMQAAAGYGSFGAPLTQAAAGYGALTQAAAGFGAPMLTQAAAGVGEYMVQGAAGYGEYEAVNGVGSAVGMVDEGIMGGDTAAAEHALTISEAAAGIGDLPMKSTWMPEMATQPVEDVPGGMRSGVFEGGDGIFG